MGKVNKLSLGGELVGRPMRGMRLAKTMRRITPRVLGFENDGDKPFERFLTFNIESGGEFETTFLASKHFNRYGSEGEDSHNALLDMLDALEDFCGVGTLAADEERDLIKQGILPLSHFAKIEVETDE